MFEWSVHKLRNEGFAGGKNGVVEGRHVIYGRTLKLLVEVDGIEN